MSKFTGPKLPKVDRDMLFWEQGQGEFSAISDMRHDETIAKIFSQNRDLARMLYPLFNPYFDV